MVFSSLTFRGLRRFAAGALFALSLFITACGGGGGGGGGGTGGGGDTGGGDTANVGANAGYDLDNITFSTRTAPALSTVTISGVPEGVTGMELFAEYSVGVTATVGEGSAIGYTLIEKVDNTTAKMYVPPFIDGEVLTLVVTDNISRSDPVTFTVESVPDAPANTFRDAVMNLAEVFEAAYINLGYTETDFYDMLYDDNVSIDMHEVNLAHTFHMIKDLNNPDSLVMRLADPDNATDPFTDEELRYLNIFARESGFDTAVQEALDNVSAVETEYTGAFAAVPDLSTYTPTVVTPAPAKAASRASSSPTILSPPYDITTKEDLADKMQAYERARDLHNDLERAEDLFGFVAIIGAAASAPLGGVAGAAIEGSVKAVELALLSSSETSAAMKWMLPSNIPDMQINPVAGKGSPFEENRPDPQYEIGTVVATAETEGTDITKEIADRVLSKLKDKAMSGTVEKVYGDAINRTVDQQIASPALEETINNLTGKTVTFRWSGIEIKRASEHVDSDVWITITAEPVFPSQPVILDKQTGVEDAFLLNESVWDGETRRAKIRVEPEMQHFPQGAWTVNVSESTVVEALPLKAYFDPSVERIEAGQTLAVTFSVDNDHSAENLGGLVNGDVEPNATTADWQGAITPSGVLTVDDVRVNDTTIEMDVTAPDPLDADFFPLSLTVERRPVAGLYNRSTPSEWPSATVFFTNENEINLSAVSCLEVGQTRTIEAVVLPTSETLSWTGTVNGTPSGDTKSFTFTASTVGDHQVTATGDTNGESETEEFVVAESCACRYDVEINPKGSWSGAYLDGSFSVNNAIAGMPSATWQYATIQPDPLQGVTILYSPFAGFTPNVDSAGTGLFTWVDYGATFPLPEGEIGGGSGGIGDAPPLPMSISWNGDAYHPVIRMSGQITGVQGYINDEGDLDTKDIPLFVSAEIHPQMFYFGPVGSTQTNTFPNFEANDLSTDTPYLDALMYMGDNASEYIVNDPGADGYYLLNVNGMPMSFTKCQ